MSRLLLLAGTAEAREVAEALAGEVPVLASLAGATRAPLPQGVATRSGGFGGEAGFRACLDAEGITAVLDATHPYAARISRRSAHVCAERGLPYAQILRPAWRAGPGDDWTWIDRAEDATRRIPQGATVFLATGRQSLPAFANLADRTLLCRQIDPPKGDFPYPNGRFITGRPPFSVEDETALFKLLGVDWLVVKNAGGEASRAKLDAARVLGLQVAMIRRPTQPDARKLESVAAALAWVRGL